MCFPVGGKTKKVIDARQPGDTKTPEILQTTTVRLIHAKSTGGMAEIFSIVWFNLINKVNLSIICLIIFISLSICHHISTCNNSLSCPSCFFDYPTSVLPINTTSTLPLP